MKETEEELRKRIEFLGSALEQAQEKTGMYVSGDSIMTEEDSCWWWHSSETPELRAYILNEYKPL